MTAKNEVQQNFWSILGWVVALAFLSVGARNFEEAITLDGPFYATIARNIVRSGNWFTLNTSIPDIDPFYGNPHLGFWVFASWLKIFPARDWALRIVGHLYYVAFLVCFFYYLRRKSGEKVAAISVILLWSWFQFSNTHSNVYLDPGALFWGALSIFLADRKDAVWWGFVLSGAALALCALYKSMTFVGFVPALILIAMQNSASRMLLIQGAGYLIVVGSYLVLLRSSPEPLFLQKYWSVQITHRFAEIWDLRNIFSIEYWRQFLYYSYYLSPLALLAFRKRTLSESVVPVTIAGSFILIYSLSQLVGGQYLIMIMPWLAWLIALGVSESLSFSPGSMVKFTRYFSIILACLIQYIPITTHAKPPSAEQIELRRLSQQGIVKKIFLDLPAGSPFVIASSFAWYGDVTVEYPTPSRLPSPRPGLAYFLHKPDEGQGLRLLRLGWCRAPGRYQEGSLWLECSARTF